MIKAVGIDFGTTNSLVAWMDGDAPIIIPNERGDRHTPSVVALDSGGRFLVGESARNQAMADPSKALAGVKRLMGKGGRPVLGGKAYDAEELAAAVFSKLRRDAQAFLGVDELEAVVTVPARFSDPQRRAVREAARRAGIRVRRVMNEPTAAALARAWFLAAGESGRAGGADPAAAKPGDGDDRLILVYDFGGGTFDATALRSRGSSCRVLASEGDDGLGGMDLDAALYRETAGRFESEFGIKPDDDPYLARMLLDLCEKAKIELSSREEAAVAVPFLRGPNGVLHPSVTLSRARFEELARPLIERSLELTKKVLAAAGADRADALVLSGGSSRIPLVARMVAELCGKAPDPRVNPEELVALGAAVEAARLEGRLPRSVAGFEFTDLCSRSFGLEIDGGGFIPLIKKGEPLPALGQRVFTTVEDYQKSVEMHVLQYDREEAPAPSPASAEAAPVSVGRFLLPGIRAARRGEPRILVEFSLDEGDLLLVSAKDLDTGAEQSVRFFEGRDELLSTADRALSLAARAKREAESAELDGLLSAELDELSSMATEAARAADNEKAGRCATLLEGLLAEIAARPPRRS